ncbi:unnamed protein product [Lota lota]
MLPGERVPGQQWRQKTANSAEEKLHQHQLEAFGSRVHNAALDTLAKENVFDVPKHRGAQRSFSLSLALA